MRGSRAREVDSSGAMQTKTPMPRFKNRRHERFAWLIAKGMYEGPLLTAGLLRHLLCGIRIQAQLGLRGPRGGAKGAETELRRKACNGE